MGKKDEVKACADCGVTGENENLMQISAAGKKTDWFCQTCLDKRFKALQESIRSEVSIRFAAVDGVSFSEKLFEGKTKQVVNLKMSFIKDDQGTGVLEKLSAQMAKGNDLFVTLGAMQLDMNLPGKTKEDF